MGCLEFFRKNDSSGQMRREEEEYTLDSSVDRHGNLAVRQTTGKWPVGVLILVNQGLATLGFFGVGVNLVLFLTRVMGHDNADAANDVSKWTGTVYLFSLVGAFLSDSYWGRYKTCAIFQVIFVVGLVSLSLSSCLFLLNPHDCGTEETHCYKPSGSHIALFYVSIYMVALGNGGYQPNIATFGADQFDEEHPKESQSKLAFFSYFYLALNLGCLLSNTVLGYYENKGLWAIGLWASTASAALALALFLVGSPRYRHFVPGGNPLSRFCKVIVAAAKKWKVDVPPEGQGLFELDAKVYPINGSRKMSHTEGFKFFDKAAVIPATESTLAIEEDYVEHPWSLCTITQVEEVKCILRLIPVWVCTILYSVVFTQMASLFVEQGASMQTDAFGFHVPPAAMSSFDILSVAATIFLQRRFLDPLMVRVRKKRLTELQRMGIGLIFAVLAMLSAGTVEVFRLKYANKDCGDSCEEASSLSIFWQVPQYALIGASEVFMYVGQLEFFNGQAPDGLRSFGSAFCFMSMSIGNYMSTVIVSIVMKISSRDDMPGWIPEDLNKGHLDLFYFLLAGLTAADFLVYLLISNWYKYVKFEGSRSGSVSHV